MLKKILIAAIVLMGISCVAQAKNTSAEIAAEVLKIKSPEVNAIIPTEGNAQVFMELDNDGTAAHKVIAAYSPVAKLTQLHQTIKKNDKAYMQRVPAIIIKPHHEQDLQQGGFHVMLIGLNQSLKKGHEIPMVLLFEDGSYLNLNVTVI